jgi:hypothetical protein
MPFRSQRWAGLCSAVLCSAVLCCAIPAINSSACADSATYCRRLPRSALRKAKPAPIHSLDGCETEAAPRSPAADVADVSASGCFSISAVRFGSFYLERFVAFLSLLNQPFVFGCAAPLQPYQPHRYSRSAVHCYTLLRTCALCGGPTGRQ